MSRLSTAPFSIFDLAPLRDDDRRPGPALRRSLALAQRAERLGFSRCWLADVVVSGGSRCFETGNPLHTPCHHFQGKEPFLLST